MRLRKSHKRSLERLLIAITVIPLVAVLIVTPITLALYFLVYVPQTVQVGWLVLRSPERSTHQSSLLFLYRKVASSSTPKLVARLS